MTSKAVSVPTSTGLSELIHTNAKIGMPEIVSIFLSKYESDLYDKKADLLNSIEQSQKDGMAHDENVLANADFSSYGGETIPKLKLVTHVNPSKCLHWDKAQVKGQIDIKSTDPAKAHQGAIASEYIFDNIKKADIKIHNQILIELGNFKQDLAEVINNIVNMNRKQRQLEGQISALRLKDAGMDKFINDPTLLSLIKV